MRKDWGETNLCWIDQYQHSADHPHRQLIIDVLKMINPESVCEIGCNSGPNLLKIQKEFPKTILAGIDINSDSVFSCNTLSGIVAKTGSILSIPFKDKTFDVVLADAVLMYITPKEILNSMNEMDRIAKKGIIIVDWYDENSLSGIEKDYHWCRNYQILLQEKGFKVKKIKITKELWPNPRWIEHGYLFSGVRAA